MKLNKIIGGIAAVVLAASLASVSASALSANKYIDERKPGKDYFVIVNSDDKKIAGWSADASIAASEVYGVRFYIKVNDPSQGYGGGIGINSTSNNWESHDWGNADAGKEITSDGKTVELLKDAPVFKDGDAYANFFLQNWWGDFTVTSVELLGKDGVVLSVDDAPAETEAAPAEETVAETTVAETAAEEAAEEDTAAEEEEDFEEEDEEEDVYVEVNAIPMFASTDWSVSDMSANSMTITGDGTYTMEFQAAGSPDFGVFCIDFEGMYANYPTAEAVLDKIVVDGEEVEFDPDQIAYGDLEEKGNFRIDIYNQYSETKDTTGFDHTLPINETLEVTFTIKGLDDAALAADSAEAEEEDIDFEEEEEEAAPVEEEAPVTVEEAAPAETEAAPAPAPAAETSSTGTGNMSVPAIAAVMALAACGAVASRKRK
ncbi:MAG: hypothetical protein II936_05635 [Oscillospiraceae bacterium]|nr:hypothetical protein [Oscillospiraceae bacterium]